jgi:hypothetical protein|tara:strand:+ start:1276 stop:1419 length:144 start_codon:yes stop_codon:yes gene_type:complete
MPGLLPGLEGAEDFPRTNGASAKADGEDKRKEKNELYATVREWYGVD